MNREQEFNKILFQWQVLERYGVLLRLNRKMPAETDLEQVQKLLPDAIDCFPAADLQAHLQAIENGDDNAENRLYEAGKELVESIACRCEGILDLVDRGHMIRIGKRGLLTAVRSYDPNVHAAFALLAAWFVFKAIREAHRQANTAVPQYLLTEERREKYFPVKGKRTIKEIFAGIAADYSEKAYRPEELLSGYEEEEWAPEFLFKLESAPCPDKEEESAFLRLKDADKSAKEVLCKAYLALAAGIAKEYACVPEYATGCYTKGYPELMQYAERGLEKAVRQYKTELPYPFRTFAIWRIHMEVIRGLTFTGDELPFPPEFITRQAEVWRSYEMIAKDHQPTFEELYDMAGEDIDEIIYYQEEFISLPPRMKRLKGKYENMLELSENDPPARVLRLIRENMEDAVLEKRYLEDRITGRRHVLRRDHDVKCILEYVDSAYAVADARSKESRRPRLYAGLIADRNAVERFAEQYLPLALSIAVRYVKEGGSVRMLWYIINSTVKGLASAASQLGTGNWRSFSVLATWHIHKAVCLSLDEYLREPEGVFLTGKNPAGSKSAFLSAWMVKPD
ncbi:MAG: hypothetical protein IJM50_00980 [Lachnospiraceae bacterium]|nr:hypothetical protein [Lachnospiraceae bacterium]